MCELIIYWFKLSYLRMTVAILKRFLVLALACVRIWGCCRPGPGLGSEKPLQWCQKCICNDLAIVTAVKCTIVLHPVHISGTWDPYPLANDDESATRKECTEQIMTNYDNFENIDLGNATVANTHKRKTKVVCDKQNTKSTHITFFPTCK